MLMNVFFVCVCMSVCLVVVGFFYSQFRDAVNNFSSRCFCNAASFFFFPSIELS